MSNNNQQQPTQGQPQLTLEQMCIKSIFDSQQNINTLIAMQNQQMIYINSLLQSIQNASNQPQLQQQSAGATNPTGATTTAVGDTNPQVTETSQPADNEPVATQD